VIRTRISLLLPSSVSPLVRASGSRKSAAQVPAAHPADPMDALVAEVCQDGNCVAAEPPTA